jgi:SpoVK/Ycf46/Vps4 family AAA+-type ATPase
MMNISRLLLATLLLVTIPLHTTQEAPHTPIIRGMIGKPPSKVWWIIKQLLLQDETDGPLLIKNRLILHGAPGNGKSTLARMIAELTDRVFIQLDGPSIVNKFQGSGAEKVEQLFKDVISNIEIYGTKAIIFIDEIDAIAVNTENEHRGDHKAALQQLWLELDRYKNDPRIFVVVATNHFKKLDNIFLDRFGNNIIELKNPGPTKRKAVLVHYLAQRAITLDDDLIDVLIAKSRGLSVRSLEDFASDIHMMAAMENNGVVTKTMALKVLNDIKSKFEKESDEEWKKKLDRVNTYVSIVSGTLSSLINSLILLGRR